MDVPALPNTEQDTEQQVCHCTADRRAGHRAARMPLHGRPQSRHRAASMHCRSQSRQRAASMHCRSHTWQVCTLGSGSNWLMVCVEGVELKSVLPRGGLRSRPQKTSAGPKRGGASWGFASRTAEASALARRRRWPPACISTALLKVHKLYSCCCCRPPPAAPAAALPRIAATAAAAAGSTAAPTLLAPTLPTLLAPPLPTLLAPPPPLSHPLPHSCVERQFGHRNWLDNWNGCYIVRV
jgi:hypothetical protein